MLTSTNALEEVAAMLTYGQDQHEELKSDRREALILLAVGLCIPAMLAAVFGFLIISKQGATVALAASAVIIALTWAGVLILPGRVRRSSRAAGDRWA